MDSAETLVPSRCSDTLDGIQYSALNPANRHPEHASVQGIHQLSSPDICHAQCPAEATLFERRQKKGRIDPIRLDCIRPFTSKSDSICVLSAPATHIRLQTMPCGDGLVVHRCIDIRTHEFFLHPERISGGPFEPSNSSTGPSCEVANAAVTSTSTEATGSSSSSCGIPSCPVYSETHSGDSGASSKTIEPPSGVRSAPHGICVPFPHSEPIVNDFLRPPSRRPPSPSRGRGCGESPGTGGSKRKAGGSEGSAPGTPCNVETVAWLVGAVGAVAGAQLRQQPSAIAGGSLSSAPDGGAEGGGAVLAQPRLPGIRLSLPPLQPLANSLAQAARSQVDEAGSPDDAADEAARRKRARLA